MLAAIRRCASFVEFSLMTVKATWPGLMCFKPSLREINLQPGGKIEETRTILHAAMPALRRASSKLESLSRCLPTPLVRKIFLATNAMVPGYGASVSEVTRKNFRCGKITSMYCSVKRIRGLFTRQRHTAKACRVVCRARGSVPNPRRQNQGRRSWHQGPYG